MLNGNRYYLVILGRSRLKAPSEIVMRFDTKFQNCINVALSKRVTEMWYNIRVVGFLSLF